MWSKFLSNKVFPAHKMWSKFHSVIPALKDEKLLALIKLQNDAYLKQIK